MEEVGPPPNKDEQQLPPSFKELGSIIFFINDLPLNVPKIDDEYQPDPNDVGTLAATYMLPLQIMLTTQLNSVAYIRAIYVNFGPKGYYKFNPKSLLTLVGDQEEFTAMLDELFENEVIRCRETNIVLRHKITTDPSSLLANLHATSRIVGCLDGNESIGATPIKDYLKSAPPSPEEPIVFVVGQVLGQEIQSHIDDYVQVDESKRSADSHLTILLDAMEGNLFYSKPFFFDSDTLF